MRDAVQGMGSQDMREAGQLRGRTGGRTGRREAEKEGIGQNGDLAQRKKLKFRQCFRLKNLFFYCTV